MKTLLSAIVLSIAVPAVAHAQTAPAAAPKAGCCASMQKECCKDMKSDCCQGMDHSKMDHSKMDHSSMGNAPQTGADPHAGHSMPTAPAPSAHQH